jgi:DNA-binding response OmpR family regulator
VVDDNEMNRNMLARGLHREQHYFALAADGEQALAILETGDFDLVLLDILMPGVDGFEVLRRLKANPQLAHVPVIMISALDEISSVVRCIEMGAADYLPKPFNPVLLRARVNACLEQKRLRDKELDYLRQVGLVTEAAAAMEVGKFQPDTLQGVSGRSDALGRLARVFVSMAREVQAREQRLQQQVQQLRIEIDQARKTQQVTEVTDSQYFRDLQSKVEQLRRRKPREGG